MGFASWMMTLILIDNTLFTLSNLCILSASASFINEDKEAVEPHTFLC